jgi:hypothetical protein
VLIGLFAGIIVTLGTDIVLHATGVFPPWGQPVGDLPLMLATAYRSVYGIGASCIIARLAPHRPMGCALVGGLLGLV